MPGNIHDMQGEIHKSRFTLDDQRDTIFRSQNLPDRPLSKGAPIRPTMGRQKLRAQNASEKASSCKRHRSYDNGLIRQRQSNGAGGKERQTTFTGKAVRHRQ